MLPSGLDDHCTLGVGLPLTLAWKTVVAPAHVVRFVGELLTTGAVFTVTVTTAQPEV